MSKLFFFGIWSGLHLSEAKRSWSAEQWVEVAGCTDRRRSSPSRKISELVTNFSIVTRSIQYVHPTRLRLLAVFDSLDITIQNRDPLVQAPTEGDVLPDLLPHGHQDFVDVKVRCGLQDIQAAVDDEVLAPRFLEDGPALLYRVQRAARHRHVQALALRVLLDQVQDLLPLVAAVVVHDEQQLHLLVILLLPLTDILRFRDPIDVGLQELVEVISVRALAEVVGQVRLEP